MDQKHHFRVNNMPYLYNKNQPIGENTIGTINKKFAEIVGFDNWERCTGHGNRTLAITTAVTNADKGCLKVTMGYARHASVKAHMGYNKDNEDQHKVAQKAVRGKHITSPPRSPEDRKLA